MTQQNLSGIISSINAAGVLTQDDLRALQRAVYDDGHITLAEAEDIFRLNDGEAPMPEGWDDFFIGAMTDYLIRQTLPEKQINDATAMWLIERISQDGLIETSSEIALLMNVLKRAERVSPQLEQFALRQVTTAVIEGTGFLGRERELKPGIIGVAEVEMIRTILYACGGAGGVGITQQEAELIFDLNDATSEQENDESWTRLFVGTIANHLMVMGAPARPSFDQAMARDKWLSSNEGLTFNLAKSFKAWFAQAEEKSAPWSLSNAAAISEAERVTDTEARWLSLRISRDGVIHKNEAALLKFLQEECPDIHSSLRPLIQAAA